MSIRDRLRRGLAKRMIADGIYEPMAVIFAEASYPSKPPAVRVRPVVSPADAGRIIERAIMPERQEGWELLARLQDPEAAAEARTQSLARALYGRSAGALAEVVLGAGTADALGFEWPERPKTGPQRAHRPLPAAGWYPDKAAGVVRWWDGSRWTDRTRPAR